MTLQDMKDTFFHPDIELLIGSMELWMIMMELIE